MKKLIFSTVLYNTPLEDLKRLLDSIDSLSIEFMKREVNIKIEKLLIIDNSINPEYFPENLLNKKYSFKVVFMKSKENLGYGMGHNKNLLVENSDKDTWYVALNPDIYFLGSQLIGFFEFIISSMDITCSAPLIYLPNGNIQYSAKKNPTMFSLLISRFSFFQKFNFLNKYLNKNHNKHFNYEKECINAPFLSGCFLVFPSQVYKKINGFSKKYFLHFEDADIVRRCNLRGITLHCPYGSVTHIRGRGSHKSISQQFYLTVSYIKYSKKWGFRLF